MTCPRVSRRDLLQASLLSPFVPTLEATAPDSRLSTEDRQILALIEAHRPSRLKPLPRDFAARFGTTHVAGKYCLSSKPFLLEGAEKMLTLGTRLGKFWFDADRAARDYPFHSHWGSYRTLTELAKSEYYARLLDMPFATLMMEAMTPAERGWRDRDPPERFYTALSQEFFDVTAHLYRVCRDRPVTLVLQNWEGDWLLRGNFGSWDRPPADWRTYCQRMSRWLAARQNGVARARERHGGTARCVVAHAAEVNKVTDAWKGIPTMTRNVLPQVEVDLVCYSAYDSFKSPLTFWKAIAEIRRHARTGPLFGRGAVAVGEFGIPENRDPDRIEERYDLALGVMLAAKVRFAAHWELYCNEFADGPQPTPVRDGKALRGFWLVRPDGSLSKAGRYFQALWKRAGEEASR